jgi:hypothetical protein
MNEEAEQESDAATEKAPAASIADHLTQRTAFIWKVEVDGSKPFVCKYAGASLYMPPKLDPNVCIESMAHLIVSPLSPLSVILPCLHAPYPFP